MTIRREDGNGMRHSSSWPDRSRRTVRVRVDPLSRAFTIVPAAVSRSEEEEEKLEIFRKSSGDNTEKIEKKDEESSIREADRKSGARREFQKKTLHSSLRALNRHRLYVETSLSSTISTGRRRGRSNSSIELKIFDVASIHGLNDDGVGSVKKEGTLPAAFTSHSRERDKEEDEDEIEDEEKIEEEKRETSSSKQQPTVVLTPHIEIVDYDRISGGGGGDGTSTQSDRHACPKCTSEGQLRLQVDPFRSPIAYDASNGPISLRTHYSPSILCGRRRRREIDRSNPRGRSTWPDGRITSFTTGYLAKRETTFPRKKRNGFPTGNQQTCRPYDLRKEATLRRHYYPEGGWGYVIVTCSMLVHFLGIGLQFAAPGSWHVTAELKFHHPPLHSAGWLGAMSTGVALLVSPVTIAFCRRKSTRVTAVLGGLVTALGCLFTSFASQFHQLFFSYGTMVGIGVSMTRDCSTLMVAQYFKRRRELVEIFIVSGSGLGIAVMSAFIKGAISKIGWRLGLQAVTGVVFLTFILGTFYRSASLYHPQRRAILHLKNQKRKIKDKNKTDDRPPFFDFSTLKSKTVRILLVSTGISAFGINTPIFYLAHQAEEEGLGDTVVLLQAYLGLAWTLGCVAFGLLVVHRNVECRIARQYLTQAAVFVCGLCILALTAVQGNYHGYVMFTWIYGIFCGGYHYSLKMYTYERVRARNFARTWGFVQCSQAIPIAIGVPISGYINVGCGGKAGYYFSSTCVLVGSFTLFFIDLHRRNLSRHKHTRANGSKHLCVLGNCPQQRRPSFSQEPENDGTHVAAAGAAAAALVLGAELAPAPGDMIDALGAEKPELTCISEEGIADMDLPDNLLEDLDYIGDCITSCNKVENYLMLSEFENNLIAEMPIIMDRRGRRWSLARSKANQATGCGQQTSSSAIGGNSPIQEEDSNEMNAKWHLGNQPINANSRTITVIDEASA